jgi:DNA adenine methylase
MKIPTFLKWLGGKRKLLSQIDPYLPNKIERYFEPMLGGGSMFFYIKQKYNPRYCMISDINEDLIDTYKAVRDNPKELMRYLKYFKKKNSETFFYQTRKKFNERRFLGIKRSAVFIYLNKTCFNGVYRVNKKNEFNVPYGSYEDREIYNSEDILFASKLLQGVDIIKQDYRDILSYLKKNDLVYLDPCYDPLKRTSFVQYTPDKFSLEDRRNLFEFMVNARMKGAILRLSNNKLNKVWKLYESAGFIIHEVKTCRTVNSNILDRGKISELIICN